MGDANPPEVPLVQGGHYFHQRAEGNAHEKLSWICSRFRLTLTRYVSNYLHTWSGSHPTSACGRTDTEEMLQTRSKLTSRKLPAADRRRQIIEVAMALFSAKGFEGTTTREISRAA